MVIAVILQVFLWIWFLGCTVTYRFGRRLLVGGMGVKSAEFAMLCLYTLGLAAWQFFPSRREMDPVRNPAPLAGRSVYVPLVLHDLWCL